MEKTRIHLALIAMVASMSLLAACSKGEDANAPASGAPGTTAPAPAPTPGASPSDTPALAPSSGQSGTMEESAKQAANTISDKAVELKDSAAEKAGQVGDAIKEGAAKADKAIQDSLGNKSASSTATTPASQAKP
ncbi:MAG: hypothetical protein WBA83_04270 [Burkholderiaceae bacterium]